MLRIKESVKRLSPIPCMINHTSRLATKTMINLHLFTTKKWTKKMLLHQYRLILDISQYQEEIPRKYLQWQQKYLHRKMLHLIWTLKIFLHRKNQTNFLIIPLDEVVLIKTIYLHIFKLKTVEGKIQNKLNFLLILSEKNQMKEHNRIKLKQFQKYYHSMLTASNQRLIIIT